MRITAPDMAVENDPRIAQFLQRAERFMERVEASLDQGIAEPDWGAPVAMRYRRQRSGQGGRVTVHDSGEIRFSGPKGGGWRAPGRRRAPPRGHRAECARSSSQDRVGLDAVGVSLAGRVRLGIAASEGRAGGQA